MTRRALPLALAGIAVTLLACGRGAPAPAASLATASPDAGPAPTAPASPPARSSAGVVPTGTGGVRPSPTDVTRPQGDLSITLAGGCTWYLDSAGGLWLNPTLRAFWTGPTAFPANGFSMTADHGTKTAGGPVTSSAPFTWAIGGEPAAGNDFLASTVRLTVRIDPVNSVPETNETNNVTIIEVVVPQSGYGTSPAPVPCSTL